MTPGNMEDTKWGVWVSGCGHECIQDTGRKGSTAYVARYSSMGPFDPERTNS